MHIGNLCQPATQYVIKYSVCCGARSASSGEVWERLQRSLEKAPVDPVVAPVDKGSSPYRLQRPCLSPGPCLFSMRRYHATTYYRGLGLGDSHIVDFAL